MYARIKDMQDYHREYCENYWAINELQLIGTMACFVEAKRLEKRQEELVVLLGYVPEA